MKKFTFGIKNLFITIYEKIKKIHYMHYICLSICIACLLCSVFIFPNAFIRISESFNDLWNSICFYVKELFNPNINATPTVNDYSSVPASPIFGLPETWEEFQIKYKAFWKLFFSFKNIQAYLTNGSDFLYNFCQIVLILVIPLALLFIILFQRYLNKNVVKDNVDSKPLTFYKYLQLKIYKPVNNWCLTFLDFINTHKNYKTFCLLLWLYNFNVFTIIIEFIAFYLYFVVSFDFVNIYRQFYKLFCDLSVVISFIPTFLWVIIGYFLFCRIRKNIGYKGLYHNESKDCGFINERPIVTMCCGSMGKKKTTMITDMALSENVILRDKALEKMFNIDMNFPEFPWINLERFVRHCIDKHIIYSLASCRRVIKELFTCFITSINYKGTPVEKAVKRRLRRKYKLLYENLLFDYDLALYPLTYYDELSETSIWKAIEDYAQLFTIYLKETYIVANLSVRSSSKVIDNGNFVLWDDDFFMRDNRNLAEFSTYSKILPFDALRLGKKLVKDNVYKDVFEFGVVVITEIGKERKNNLELQGKKKNDEDANQKTDGFNDWLKMVRHSATVDSYPFVKVLCDEQRPESWGADARDLCEIVSIDESTETKLTMPWFFAEELMYDFMFKRFMNFYYKYRLNRSDNTLLMHVVKKICSSYLKYYNRIYNTFGYFELKTIIEKGTQDGEKKAKSYYLSKKKIYSKVFSTDCFNGFFTEKALRSKVGFDDLPNYAGVKATLDELLQQNSYFIYEMIEKFRETGTK